MCFLNYTVMLHNQLSQCTFYIVEGITQVLFVLRHFTDVFIIARIVPLLFVRMLFIS